MSAPSAQASRRMHRATVLTAVLAIAPLTLVLVATTAESWWEGVAIGAGLGVAFFVLYEWRPARLTWVMIAALAFSALVWVASTLFGFNPLGFFGVALLGGVMIPRLPRHHIPAAIGIGLLVGATGSLYFTHEPLTWDNALRYVLLPTGFTVFVVAVILILERHRAILHDLEAAQRAEAELGIMRERVRFATDLHDIQGHTLHVVNLKVALADAVLDADPERARRELREVYAEVEATIARTSALAHGQHRVNLDAEIENAKNLLEAAGIEVRISRTASEDPRSGEALGQVLRETTTNILRHSDAASVDIDLTGHSLRVINDGAAHSGELRLSGLAMLHERVAADGGALTAERTGERFITTVRLPRNAGVSRDADDGVAAETPT